MTVLVGVKVWLSTGNTDMHKGSPGLSLMVQETMKRHPMCGQLFVFRGRGGGLINVICLMAREAVCPRRSWNADGPSGRWQRWTGAQLGYRLRRRPHQALLAKLGKI